MKHTCAAPEAEKGNKITLSAELWRVAESAYITSTRNILAPVLIIPHYADGRKI